MKAVSYIYMTIILLLFLASSFYIAINILHVNFFKSKYTNKMDCEQFKNLAQQIASNCKKYGTCFYGYINLTERCLGYTPGYYFLKIDKLPTGTEVKLIKIK